MLGLLGIGLAMILGVALRPAAVCAIAMKFLMWLAVWVPASTIDGQPSGSTNPIVDEQIVGIFGFVLIAALALWGTGYLGRALAALPIVNSRPWLR